MIEDDFFATIKFKSGEEIFAKVAPTDEEDRIMLIITNPITVSLIKTRQGTVGYKIEPWLKTTREDMFIVDFDNVLTISESNDIDMIQMYQTFIRQSKLGDTEKLSRKMGYLANVNDAKELLEKLYKKDLKDT